MLEKTRTALGYTETDSGPIQHLRIVGIFGISEVIQAPVSLVPHNRNSRGLPYPEMFNGMWVFILPGGLKIRQDGKLVESYA